MTFEEWLESEEGAMVQKAIANGIVVDALRLCYQSGVSAGLRTVQKAIRESF